MFDKELFNKICNASCSSAELKEFITDIDKKEFDTVNPFEKYYGVEKIISVIEKYQSKEIDANFLSGWMNAYNWIIMGGFKNAGNGNSISLKEFLVWEIADWLDSLSFFDDSDDWYNLEDYENAFRVLDSVLRDIDDCKAVCTEYGYSDGDEDYDQEGGIILIINDEAKYYIKIFVDSGYDFTQLDFEKIEFSDLKNREKRLSSLGYRELQYYLSHDED